MKTGVIAEVEYKRESKFVGVEGSGVEFMENVVTFEDETKGIRLGITKVYGKNVKEMTESLHVGLSQMDSSDNWWSLQVTSLTELKAAYRARFRNQSLSSLEEHINAFHNHCGTLQMEYVKGEKSK